MEEDGQNLVTRILQIIGEDPLREGLKDTPKRVTQSWKEIFEGYQFSPKELTAMLTRFPGPSNPVGLDGIHFASMCEHHMMPYHGIASIHYTPTSDGVIGLSKLPRIVQILAHRLTIQEQLTQDIADVIAPVTAGVCVEIVATHSCIEDRGIRSHGVETRTIAHVERWRTMEDKIINAPAD